MFQYNITRDEAENQFKKALILSDDGTTYYLAEETYVMMNPTYNIIVKKTMLDSRLAETGNLAAYASQDGVILCSPGCGDCSNQTTCSRCNYGFVFKTSSGECLPCGPGCATCDPNDPLMCTGCLNGTVLVAKNCIRCDSSCLTCMINPKFCISCKPGFGFYFDASGMSSCKVCPKNCNNCTSSSTCL